MNILELNIKSLVSSDILTYLNLEAYFKFYLSNLRIIYPYYWYLLMLIIIIPFVISVILKFLFYLY